MEENTLEMPEVEMEPKVMHPGANISNNEIQSLNDYIKRHNTAILVIMFTDIEGFTRLTEVKGEKYSSKIRKYHDEILVSTIEENDSGKVIKFIGDAVMAVFSEPISAVKKSLSIQRKLRKFNEEHHELENIKVRIGLHMGQVALEDNIHADVFGRHVNRASRIEGLASGGQVFITFPVFDSAKGWLLDDETISWKFHGSYFLKGIDKPSEIYEVYNVGETTPKAPQKGKKVKAVATPLVITLIVLLLAISGFLTFKFMKKEKPVKKPPVVTFVDNKVRETIYLNNDTISLLLDAAPGEHMRKSLRDIPLGKHVAYWNVSSVVRYYAPFEVVDGENYITLDFEHFQLPQFTLQGAVKEDNDLVLDKKLTDTFSYYNEKCEIVKSEVAMYASIIGSLEGDTASYIISYKVSIDGEKPLDNSIVRKYNIKDKTYRGPWTEVVRVGPITFNYRFRASRNFVNFYINGFWDRPSFIRKKANKNKRKASQ